MIRQHLPLGIQNFGRLRETNSYYVDKTPLIRDLVERGDHWFLSRPRRFGKSLLLDTIKALFAGKQTLFQGLDIHDHWDWSVSHPVVRLSFDGNYNRPDDIERNILAQLKAIERRAELTASIWPTAPEYLFDVLERLHHKTGQPVVVLVDEYDKPILDVLPDSELAVANRDYLRGFYGIIKGSAEHVRFVFVTGVSMFSKVSLFSGLNNLEDISLDPRYGALCGYTDADLDTVFAPELDGLDRGEIRNWYNGYNWRGDIRVYNPFDLLRLFRTRTFKPHWFRTGSPRFLLEMLKEKAISPTELEGRMINESLICKFDVDDIGIEALLFQTGYLTITGEKTEGVRTFYKLDYPNLEVRLSLNDELLAYLDEHGHVPLDQGQSLLSCLEANDFVSFSESLRALFSSLPYQWHIKDKLSRYEAWYASMLHMCLRAIGAEVRSEEASSHGRADMVVEIEQQIFVIEFKMVEWVEEQNAALQQGEEVTLETATEAERKQAIATTLTAALTQIRERGYADKYRHSGKIIHLIAVACGREARNLLAVRTELG